MENWTDKKLECKPYWSVGKELASPYPEMSVDQGVETPDAITGKFPGTWCLEPLSVRGAHSVLFSPNFQLFHADS